MLRILSILMLLVASALGGAAEERPLAPGTVNPGYEEPPLWFKESFLDLRDDVAEAAKAGRRLMLYFHQDGCPYCAKLLRDNFGQKTIADKARRHFDTLAINLWGDREVTDLTGKTMTEKAFARSQRVQFTPTLLLLDEKGRVALRLNGYLPPHKFEAALDYVGGRLETKQSFTDYLAARAKEPSSGKLHDAAWLMKPPLKLAEALKRGGKPLLVLFEQKECAACDEMHAEGFPRPEVAALLGRFQVARIDMASAEPVQTPGGETLPARQWARRIGVFYTPSLAFFQAGGQEVFRVEGYLRPFHLASSLEYVASGAYREQPEFQRFIEARAAARRSRGERIELMK
ncbi:MAG: thioredoxin fold domain-containing protein [Betaproteobacteria bacterium]|nr:thioredoxin fold domain-containing protein [Betaproteobacteria bacterium]